MGIQDAHAAVGALMSCDSDVFHTTQASRTPTLQWYINVTVENPPIPFSPFSSVDCTMLSHFSFDDFIAVAFPDLAGDLDIQL